jgi:Fic family protein
MDEHGANTKKLLEMLLAQRVSQMKGGIYHANQIDLAYNSNRIEGSKLSHEQTRYIFETKTVEGIAPVNDVIETVNHFRVFDTMLDKLDAPLTTVKLKEYHRILKNGTYDAQQDWFEVGNWKKLGNVVAGKDTVTPEQVDKEIVSLLASLPDNQILSFEEIIDFHFNFERICPFQDGNGRIGRIIMFEQCLKSGILPFIVMDDDKYFYYRGLSEYPTERGFLLDTCRSFQDQYFAAYKDLIV